MQIKRRNIMQQTKRKSGSSSSKSGEDAISLLTADHKTVKKLFKDFEKIKEEFKSKGKGEKKA